MHGPHILLHLNLAYFFPSIPILLIQTLANDALIRRFGLPQVQHPPRQAAAASSRSSSSAALQASPFSCPLPFFASSHVAAAGGLQITLAKFTLGLGGLAAACHAFPAAMHSERGVLAATMLVGACYGLAFGTAYQIVARFSPADSMALTTGFVSSGLVVLALDAWGAARIPSFAQRIDLLFVWVAWLTLLGLAAALALVASQWQLLALQGSAVAGAKGHGKMIDVHSSLMAGLARGGLAGAKGCANFGYYGSGFRQRTSSGALGQGGSGAPAAAAGSMTIDVESAGHDGPLGPLGSGGNHSSGGPAGAPGPWALQPGSPGKGHYGGDGAAWGVKGNSSGRRGGGTHLCTLVHIWPSALSLFLSVGTSMLVFPFFGYVKSTGLLGDKLQKVGAHAPLRPDRLPA